MHLPERGAGVPLHAPRPPCSRGPAQALGECGHRGFLQTRAQSSMGSYSRLPKSLAQQPLAWSTLSSFPLSQLEDLEPNKVERKSELSGPECWARQSGAPGAAFGPGTKASLRLPIWWTAICQHKMNQRLVSKCSQREIFKGTPWPQKGYRWYTNFYP